MADFSIEDSQSLLACGIDEVGRGPLAGPVVAACVFIPPEIRTQSFIKRIKDSKTLSETALTEISSLIRENCLWGIGECTPTEIDEINILQASLRAMERAFMAMNEHFNFKGMALIDGNRIPKNLPCPALAVIKGDTKSRSIAAASIIAKAHRDSIMAELGCLYPAYGWENNSGYPTKAHIAALDTHGITPHHRLSFAPVKSRLAA